MILGEAEFLGAADFEGPLGFVNRLETGESAIDGFPENSLSEVFLGESENSVNAASRGFGNADELGVFEVLGFFGHFGFLGFWVFGLG